VAALHNPRYAAGQAEVKLAVALAA